MVYCGLFPVETTEYQLLRESRRSCTLNDAALTFEPETSSAMGFGFRCGFLGLLHMEIMQERLEREYGFDLIVTAPTVPSVVYKVEMNDGEVVDVDAPAKMADADRPVREPYVDMEVFCPKEYDGDASRTGRLSHTRSPNSSPPFLHPRRRHGDADGAAGRAAASTDMTFLTEERVSLKYALPLAEVITDFFDAMKSRSKGYASMEYSVSGYRPNDLVRLDILIAGEEAMPLSAIVHRDAAHQTGKGLTRR